MDFLKNNKIIVDIDSSNLKILDVVASKKQVVINNALVVDSSSFVRGGTIANIHGLAEKLVEVLEENNIKGKKLSIILPLSSVQYDFKQVPAMPAKEIKGYAEGALVNAFPDQTEYTHILDYAYFGDVINNNNLQSVIGLFSTPKNNVVNLINEFKKYKYKVENVDTPLTSLIYLGRFYNHYDNKNKLYISIGEDYIVFILLFNGIPFFVRTVPYGMKDIKKSIRQHVGIHPSIVDDLLETVGFTNEIDDATQSKFSDLGLSVESYFDLIEDSMISLKTEISKNLEYIWNTLKVDISDVILTGELGIMKGAWDYLKSYIYSGLSNVTVDTWSLVTNVGFENVILENNTDMVLDGTFAIACGLAIKEVC